MLLEQRRAWLLLDGLNEPPSHLRAAKAIIKTWLQKHPRIICCVSCRDLDYTADMAFEPDTIRIRPLDLPRIRAFLQDYLPFMQGPEGAAAAENLFWELAGGEVLRAVRAVWKKAGLSEALCRQNSPLRSQSVQQDDHPIDSAVGRCPSGPHSLLRLAANSFMLSMLAVVYAAERTLPDNRATLPADFVDSLLQREDLLDHKQALIGGLRLLAWTMQEQRSGGENIGADHAGA